MSKTNTAHTVKDNFRKGQLVLVSDTPFIQNKPLPSLIITDISPNGKNKINKKI